VRLRGAPGLFFERSAIGATWKPAPPPRKAAHGSPEAQTALNGPTGLIADCRLLIAFFFLYTPQVPIGTSRFPRAGVAVIFHFQELVGG
jgi:hypothetical protein